MMILIVYGFVFIVWFFVVELMKFCVYVLYVNVLLNVIVFGVGILFICNLYFKLSILLGISCVGEFVVFFLVFLIVIIWFVVLYVIFILLILMFELLFGKFLVNELFIYLIFLGNWIWYIKLFVFREVLELLLFFNDVVIVNFLLFVVVGFIVCFLIKICDLEWSLIELIKL